MTAKLGFLVVAAAVLVVVPLLSSWFEKRSDADPAKGKGRKPEVLSGTAVNHEQAGTSVDSGATQALKDDGDEGALVTLLLAAGSQPTAAEIAQAHADVCSAQDTPAGDLTAVDVSCGSSVDTTVPDVGSMGN